MVTASEDSVLQLDSTNTSRVFIDDRALIEYLEMWKHPCKFSFFTLVLDEEFAKDCNPS
jgi:hypothetical protein